jgi:ABC-type amino acid transport substrate-binding protein
MVLAFGICKPVVAQEFPSSILIPDHSWAPYFTSSTLPAKEQGLAMNKIQFCLGEMNVEVKRVGSSIKRTEYLLRRGGVDLWVMSYRQGRGKWLEYSGVPLFSDGYAIFRSTYSLHKFDDLDDLRGLRVGTLLGLRVSDEFQAWKKGLKKQQRPVDYSSEQALLRKLINGDLDAAVTSIGPFYAAAAKDKVRDELTMTEPALSQREYFVVLSRKATRIKNKPEFLRVLDACLVAEKNQKNFKAIDARYLGG